MLQIPVKLNLEAGEAVEALKKFEKGAEDALREIVDFNGKKVNVDFKFSISGAPVVRELTDQEKALKKVTDAYEKLTGGQAKSIGRTKKVIDQFKKKRETLDATSQAFRDYTNLIANFEGKLRDLQGVQKGSINDIKAQRDELVALRDSIAINSPAFETLSKKIKQYDDELKKARGTTKGFFSVLGKIAIAAAALQGVTSAARSVGNAIDTYTRRTKQVEGFSLALRNVGLEQGEVNRLFSQAAATAGALGAPLVQVENTYKRMVPVLQQIGTSAQDSDKFIEAVSARTQTLGLNTEQSGRLLEAFAQVLSKGKLQAEELNQQISELDGAFRGQLAKALGVTVSGLNDLVSTGQITSEVFVKAFLKMENGAEALKEKIESGNATIQQFQNLINLVDTKNIELIGKAIEPAIRSFLDIRLAISEFISEFTKTAAFENLVIVFNGVAKGVQNFVDGFLKAVSVVETFFSPLTRVVNAVLGLGDGFGGIVGIATAVTLGIVAIKIAIKSLIATSTGISYVTQQFVNLKAVMNGPYPDAAKTATTEVGTAAQQTSFSLKNLIKQLGVFVAVLAVATVIDQAVKGFTALDKAAAKMDKTFASVDLVIADEMKRLAENSKEATESLDKTTESLDSNIIASKKASDDHYNLAAILGTVGAVAGFTAAVIGTGGAALVVAGVAAAATAGSVYQLSEGFNDLAKSADGLEYIKKNLEFDDFLIDNITKMRTLGAELGRVDFSRFKGGADALEELNNITTAQIAALKEERSAQQSVIDAELQKENQNKALIETAKKRIVQANQFIDLLEETKRGISDQVVELIKQGDAAATAKASLDQLKQATASLNKEIETEKLNASTEALKRFGDAADAASLLAAANIGIAAEASVQREQAYQREIQALEDKERRGEQLNSKERARTVELTELVAKESQTQAKLGIDARNAVINAFEEGIDKANTRVDILAQSASRLKSAFDGVTSGLSEGLSAAVGLIDAIAQKELAGLEKGSAKRKEIIRAQLKAQVIANEVENSIAQLRLSVQQRIQTSEAKIAQSRLQAESKIATARGDTKLAEVLSQAAAEYDVIIQSLNDVYQIESKSLDLVKQTNDQKIITKGLNEELGTTTQEVANQFGLTNKSIGDGVTELKSMVTQANKVASEYGEVAEAAQDTTEAAQEVTLEEGLEQAEKVKDALDGAKGAAEGFKKVADTINAPFDKVEGTTKQIFIYLEDSVREASKLASIIASGTGRRAMGGPVNAGQTYTVNDGGGREGFLSNSGAFKMLPAARNMKWTAPTSGTVVPASLVDQYQRMYDTSGSNISMKDVKVDASRVNGLSASVDSGNLVQRIATAMSNSGGNQRITNHVTIQSQQPVTDASKIMTNVARAKLRRGGGI